MIKWAIRFLLASAVISFLIFCLVSPQFQCRFIVANPTAFVSSDAFKTAVEPYIGDNIFLLRFGRFKHRFEAAFPAIEHVDMTLQFPDMIQLTIKEKQPWISCLVDGATWCVAQDGTLLSSGQSNVDLSLYQALPIIDGLDASFFSDQRLSPILLFRLHQVVSDIQSVFGERPYQLSLHHVIRTPDRLDIQSATLRLDDTLPVYLTNLDRLKETLADMKLFLDNMSNQPTNQTANAAIPTKPITYIDLRVPGRIIVRYGN